MWLGVVILIALAMGITVCNRVGALAHNFFFFASLANFFTISKKTQAKLQPQLVGVMLLIWSSPKVTGLAHWG
jgi:hypothetical protein